MMANVLRSVDSVTPIRPLPITMAAWPEAPDGDGYSLELTTVQSRPRGRQNWRASGIHGTPTECGRLNFADWRPQLHCSGAGEYIDIGSRCRPDSTAAATFLVRWGTRWTTISDVEVSAERHREGRRENLPVSTYTEWLGEVSDVEHSEDLASWYWARGRRGSGVLD